MPRILQLSPRLPYPLDDGGRIATWNLSRCLRHNDYAIDLVCFTRSAGAEDECRSILADVFETVATVVKDVERQYPVTLLHALLTGTSYFARKFGSPRIAALVAERLARRPYDAVLIDSAYMGGSLPLIRRHPGAAGTIVLREHNVEYELLERLAHGASNPIYRMLLRRESKQFRRFELALVEGVDDVRMISPRDRDVLLATGTRDEIGLIAPFIDVERYRPDPTTTIEPHSLVCVGNMAWMPNANGVQWFCDRVWPGVLETHPDARFHIVGKNPPPAVARLAGDRVVVTGYVEDERPSIRRAHLFVVPLLEGSGIRIKILTALAMGKPVLSTGVGAEGIDYAGLLIRDEADAWIEAIRRHFATRPALDEAAAAYVRDQYSWRREFDLGEATERRSDEATEGSGA